MWSYFSHLIYIVVNYVFKRYDVGNWMISIFSLVVGSGYLVVWMSVIRTVDLANSILGAHRIADF